MIAVAGYALAALHPVGMFARHARVSFAGAR